LIKLLDHN